jgi:TP901 family phage tail tape measure protein
MANRTVSVALRAEIGQYVAGMSQASAATMRLGESAKASQASASKSFDLAGKGALLMGGAIAAGLGAAVSRSMEFEKSMSAVGAATQATGSTLLDLRDAAMKAGADTAFSATEAADAITEMGKAGVSAKDIMSGGLTGALSLAAAGQIDVAEAAGIASTAMTQFSLSGKDLPHVADLLAAGAGKAMGSVDDLGQALNQAGLVAASSGHSIEETTGTLAAFASAGLLGSDAGTSLKSAMLMLQGPTDKASQTMSELGINMYDSNGNMLSMAGIADQLKTHMSGLTQEQRNSALATIFGSDAVRAANVLYKEGASGINDWTAKVSDAGYASKQAAALQDNLAGDLEKLGGSFDTLLITLGQGAQGPLRELVQMLGGLVDGVTFVVDAFQSLPGPVELALAALVGIKVLGGPLNSLMDVMAPKITGVATGMGMAAANAGGFKGALGSLAGAFNPLTLGIGLASVALSNYMADSAEVDARMKSAADAGDTFRSTLAQQKGELNQASLAAADMAVQASGLADAFDKLGISSRRAASALAGNQQDFHRILADLEDMDKQAMFTNESWNQLFGTGTRMAMDAVSGKATENADAFRKAAGAAGDYFLIVGNVDAGGWGRAVAAQGETAAAATAQTEQAAQALEDWLKQVEQIGESFIDPLATYQGLLQTKQQAEQASAQATADSTKSSSDSWHDYVGNVTVSLGEYATQLEQQLAAQENWRSNIVTVTQRGGLEIGQILLGMGEQGAQITGQMATATAADFERMKTDLIREAQGATAGLDSAMKVMAAVGAAGAGATAAGIAQQLGIGVDEVAKIAAQYGVTLASGVNPVITALGRSPITIARINARNEFAEGGYTGPGHKYQPAGIVHAGEYVLTKEQTSRLGIDRIEAFANMAGYASGGFVTAADVPRPYSTAPYGAPISTAGDASMGKEYDEVTAWLKANVPTMSGSLAGVQMTGPIQDIVRSVASQFGWGAGSQWDALAWVIQHESGWRPTAQNPTSTAYGLFQFLNGTWGSTGIGKTSDPAQQALAGMRYIGSKYHDPIGAQRFWQAHGWYEDGTAYVPHTGPAYLHQGEAVLTREQGAAYRTGLASREFSGGSGGTVVNVAPPSLEGLAITGRLAMDSDGFVTLVDGRIAKAFTAASIRARYNP